MYELIRVLGLHNTLPTLTRSYLICTLPFTVWVLMTFMLELPKDLEAAAMVAGASPWLICWQVFFPLFKPALVTRWLRPSSRRGMSSSLP